METKLKLKQLEYKTPPILLAMLPTSYEDTSELELIENHIETCRHVMNLS